MIASDQLDTRVHDVFTDLYGDACVDDVTHMLDSVCAELGTDNRDAVLDSVINQGLFHITRKASK